MEKTNRKRSKKSKDSWSLFLDTLTEIGCQYKLVENDTNRATVTYKDKAFMVRFDKDEDDEDEWDYIWIGHAHNIFVNSKDKKEFSELKKLINLTNQMCNAKTYYEPFNDTDDVFPFSWINLRFIPYIPQLGLYIRFVLGEFDNVLMIIEDGMEEYRKEGKQKLEMDKKENETRQLFLDTLQKIGCPYTYDEEDDAAFFFFQGERFDAWFQDNNNYVAIWDYNWMECELYDIDNISRIKKAINEANMDCGVTTVYTIDEAGSHFDVHSTSLIAFIPQIPDIEGYLRTELREFFHTHHYIELEVKKLKQEEKGSE